jgi:uncharacterized protein with PQ loop repeat
MSRHHLLLDFHMTKKKRITLFDKFIMVAAVCYPLTTVPQITEVFKGNTEGVSVTTWGGYIIFSFLFLIYGLIHKVKPMIVSNGLWVIVNSLVAVGVLLNR